LEERWSYKLHRLLPSTLAWLHHPQGQLPLGR
jgi:hypothetical protein